MTDTRTVDPDVETAEACAFVVSYGSWVDPEPDEFCPNDAEPGSEFCAEHEDE